MTRIVTLVCPGLSGSLDSRSVTVGTAVALASDMTTTTTVQFFSIATTTAPTASQQVQLLAAKSITDLARKAQARKPSINWTAEFNTIIASL